MGFARLPSLGQEALALHRKNPSAVSKLLTDHCTGIQSQVPGMYINLREELITKYTNSGSNDLETTCVAHARLLLRAGAAGLWRGPANWKKSSISFRLDSA